MRQEETMKQLEISNVSKSFRKNEVLKNISFSVDTGTFGILGNHGSGKTTLMNMISALTKPSTGMIRFNGLDTVEDAIKVKELVGYLPQDFSLYDELNAYEMLGYIGKLNRIGTRKEIEERIEHVLELTTLRGAAYRKIGAYSPGMRRRLGIATVLMKDPQMIIVDEPTAGLDPLEQVRIRTLLTTIAENKLILLSTHRVDDIAAVCERFIFIKNKTIDFQGTPAEWLSGIQNPVIETKVEGTHQLNILAREFKVISMKQMQEGIQVRLILGNRTPDFQYTIVEPDLEDALLYYS